MSRQEELNRMQNTISARLSKNNVPNDTNGEAGGWRTRDPEAVEA
jgi:hypothetical protein